MEIKELLIYAKQLHSEYAESMVNPNNNWSGRRLANYVNGPIRGMYEENDKKLETMMSIIPEVEELKELILWFIKEEYKIDKYHKSCYGIIITSDLAELKKEANDYIKDLLDAVVNETIEKQMMYLQIFLEYVHA